MTSKENPELLTRIAWMYYFGGMNQQEIADEFSCSRIKIVRLLKQTLDSGLVHFTISGSNYSLFSLERELKAAANLKYCLVVPSLPDLSDALSRGAAYLCNDIIQMKGSLGVGLSRTLGRMYRYLDKEKCRINSVISICGTTNPNLALTQLNSGFHIAQALEVDFYTIWAPVIVGPEVDAKSIKQDIYISMVLEMAEKADYALIGIGNTADSPLLEMEYISDEDYKTITSSGAEGEILGRYFSMDGKIKNTGTEKRVISVDFPMRCPVIATAGGLGKSRAIVSVIRSGWIQGLVTDEKAALGVLELLRDQSA